MVSYFLNKLFHFFILIVVACSSLAQDPQPSVPIDHGKIQELSDKDLPKANDIEPIKEQDNNKNMSGASSTPDIMDIPDEYWDKLANDIIKHHQQLQQPQQPKQQLQLEQEKLKLEQKQLELIQQKQQLELKQQQQQLEELQQPQQPQQQQQQQQLQQQAQVQSAPMIPGTGNANPGSNSGYFSSFFSRGGSSTPNDANKGPGPGPAPAPSPSYTSIIGSKLFELGKKKLSEKLDEKLTTNRQYGREVPYNPSPGAMPGGNPPPPPPINVPPPNRINKGYNQESVQQNGVVNMGQLSLNGLIG